MCLTGDRIMVKHHLKEEMPMQGSKQPLSALSGAFVERIPDNLLLDPIAYIFADHCRQADLCEILTTFAEQYVAAKPDLQVAASIVKSLGVDLDMHIADEEIDFFPRLKVRTLPDDHFAELLRILDKEHDRDRVLADKVCAGMQRLINGEAPADPDKFRRAITTLAATHLSHLNWENAAILPLARKRLTDEDLEAIGRVMASRRSISYPER